MCVLLGIVALVAIYLVGMGLNYLCLTIGCVIAKKHKIFASIGIYYLVNMIFSLVSQILMLFFVSGLSIAVTLAVMQNRTGPAVAVILLIATAIASVLAIAFHFTTLGQIERRLNLA